MNEKDLQGWWKLNHLRSAQDLSKDGKRSPWYISYCIHFWVGIREFVVLALLAIASLLHALVPPLFHFKLLEILVNRTIGMHGFLPQHPVWKKLRDELNKPQ